MAADLGYKSHFRWTGTLIILFEIKLKFSKKFQAIYDFTQMSVFLTGLLCFSSKSLYPESITAAIFTLPKIKGLLECL